MRAWYAAALAEPWREARHEDASLATGRLIEDLRRRPQEGRVIAKRSGDAA
jgi:hypothetical protein